MRIAVVNLKGGVGKTTTSMFLAAGLGERSPTVVLDADPQGSATRWAQLAGSALPFVVAPMDAASATIGGTWEVVIDTPPGHEDLVAAAVARATVVVIPVEPLAMDLDRLTPTLDLIAAVAAREATDPDVYVLLTRVRAGTRSSIAARTHLLGRGLPVLDAEVPLLEGVGWAYGTIPLAAGAAAYGAVLAELVARTAVAA